MSGVAASSRAAGRAALRPPPPPPCPPPAMGHAPSSAEVPRDRSRNAASTTTATNNSIFRQNSIHQVQETSAQPYVAREAELLPPLPPPSPLRRDDSSSMHYYYDDCTNPAPSLNPHPDCSSGDRMMTQTSLLGLPRSNELHDLAFFLKTTGPTAPPHGKPSKIHHRPRRTLSVPRNPLRFWRSGGSRSQATPAYGARGERCSGLAIRDEGNLLSSMPVEQKVSAAGNRYLALQVQPLAADEHCANQPPQPVISCPDILESRVSICFHHETHHGGEVLDSCLSSLNRQQTTCPDLLTSAVEHDRRPIASYDNTTNLSSACFPTPPVRPAASSPPTPAPESAVSVAELSVSNSDEEMARMSWEHDQSMLDRSYQHPRPQTPKISPLPKISLSKIYLSKTSPLPKISLPMEEFPVKHPTSEKEIEIKHPLPRRVGSHPVLLQRASSVASTFYGTRTTSDSSGPPPPPPPPRSPLRLRRAQRTIESTTNNSGCDHRKTTPKTASNILTSNSELDFGGSNEPIRAIVTTECTGPIKRPKSRTKDINPGRRRPYPKNRKDGEDRIRDRKLRHGSVFNRTIDSVVHAPAQSTRQKLKKMRPGMQIPHLLILPPPPPPMRATSAASRASASTVASWKKVTEDILTAMSPAPSIASHDEDDKTGYTPISPTASAAAEAKVEVQDGSLMSPVTLVAEQIPIPKTNATPKPAKLILKEGRAYAPRPRSASIPPRYAMKQRSRTTSGRESKESTPSSGSDKTSHGQMSRHEEIPPPLPSPPPTRALPPTPPKSGSERNRKANNSKAKLVDDGSRKDYPAIVPSQPPGYSPPSASSSSPDDDNENRNPPPPPQPPPPPHISTQQRKSPSQHPPRTSNKTAARIDSRLEALERQNALLSAALMAVLKTNGTMNNAPVVMSSSSTESASNEHETSPIPSQSRNLKNPMTSWEERVARRSAAATAAAAAGTKHTASASASISSSSISSGSNPSSALEMYMRTRRRRRQGSRRGLPGGRWWWCREDGGEGYV